MCTIIVLFRTQPDFPKRGILFAAQLEEVLTSRAPLQQVVVLAAQRQNFSDNTQVRAAKDLRGVSNHWHYPFR